MDTEINSLARKISAELASFTISGQCKNPTKLSSQEVKFE